MDFARTCHQLKQHSASTHHLLNLSTIHWSLSKNYDIRTNPHGLNQNLCEAADLNQKHVLERGVCSDSYQTAQQI